MGTIKLNKNFANDEAKQTNIVKIPTAPNSDKTIQGKAVADADIKNSIKIKSSVTNNRTFVIQAPSSLSCWMVSNDGYGAQDKFYKNKLEVYARKGDAATKLNYFLLLPQLEQVILELTVKHHILHLACQSFMIVQRNIRLLRWATP